MGQYFVSEAVNSLSEESAQETVHSLQVIETVLTTLDKSLADQVSVTSSGIGCSKHC